MRNPLSLTEPVAAPGGGTAVLPVGLESMLESVRDREVRPLAGDASADEGSELLPPLLEGEAGNGDAGEPPLAGGARPFPPALETSDVWTDETIPYLR